VYSTLLRLHIVVLAHLASAQNVCQAEFAKVEIFRGTSMCKWQLPGMADSTALGEDCGWPKETKHADHLKVIACRHWDVLKP